VAALNVRYRDFRFIVTFGLQLGLYISPVGFRSEIIPEQWRLLYACNPMVGVIDGFRWALLGDATVLYWPGTVLSAVLSVLLLVSAVAHFRRMEKSFADEI
jgi:lipopolysaccharide transport system permease protein